MCIQATNLPLSISCIRKKDCKREKLPQHHNVFVHSRLSFFPNSKPGGDYSLSKGRYRAATAARTIIYPLPNNIQQQFMKFLHFWVDIITGGEGLVDEWNNSRHLNVGLRPSQENWPSANISCYGQLESSKRRSHQILWQAKKDLLSIVRAADSEQPGKTCELKGGL